MTPAGHRCDFVEQREVPPSLRASLRRPARALAAVAICAALGAGTAAYVEPAAAARRGVQQHSPVYEVRTRNVSGLGTVLVNGKGFTVYVFLRDKRSSKSTCTDICAVAWPPLVVPRGDKPIAGPGVKPSMLGTTNRSDGTRQITYNGWPLYLWANDDQPGQASGQGLNNLGGLWYVIGARGIPIRS